MTRLLLVALLLALGLLAGWWALAHGATGAGHVRRVEQAIAEAREGKAV